MTFKEIYLF